MEKSLLSKRIAIFGAGAAGCYFGRYFVDAGFQTDFIGRGNHLKALQSEGLLVWGEESVPFRLNVDAKGYLDGVYDVILVCVKSQDTSTAAEFINGHLADGGIVVSLQNGVDNPEILSSVLGKDCVVPATIYLTASINSPGVLKYYSTGKIVYGAYDEGGKLAADKFGDVLKGTKIKYHVSEDIKTIQWKKLCFNAAMNPVSAVLRMDFGQLCENKYGLEISRHIFDETRMAAGLSGVIIEEGEFDSIVSQCRMNPKFKTSMLQDIEANKNPEIDGILGAVIKVHKNVGSNAPYSEMLYNVVQGKYGGWFQVSPRLASDVLVVDGRKVLLVERKYRPYGWAIPGGFVNLNETMEQAGARELFEETGILVSVEDLELLGMYSNPKRDERGHTVSAVYVYFGGGNGIAGDDAKALCYFDIDGLPENMAFDHRDILKEFRIKYGI